MFIMYSYRVPSITILGTWLLTKVFAFCLVCSLESGKQKTIIIMSSEEFSSCLISFFVLLKILLVTAKRLQRKHFFM